MKTGKTNQAPMKQSSPIQAKAQNQRSEGSILQAYKKGTAQLAASEEEDPLQGKFDTTQLASEEEELPV